MYPFATACLLTAWHHAWHTLHLRVQAVCALLAAMHAANPSTHSACCHASRDAARLHACTAACLRLVLLDPQRLGQHPLRAAWAAPAAVDTQAWIPLLRRHARRLQQPSSRTAILAPGTSHACMHSRGVYVSATNQPWGGRLHACMHGADAIALLPLLACCALRMSIHSSAGRSASPSARTHARRACTQGMHAHAPLQHTTRPCRRVRVHACTGGP